MSEKQILEAAIGQINKLSPETKELTADDIVSSNILNTEVAIIVNRGILGCPKYIIPLVDLQLPEPKPKPEVKRRRKSNVCTM